MSLFTCDAQKDGVCFGGKNGDVFSKPSTLVPSISDVTHLVILINLTTLNAKIALNHICYGEIQEKVDETATT